MKSTDEEFREALEAGIRFFNNSQFMEAYEIWEARWTEEEGDGADLLLGLLQISVALAKLLGGNPRGTVKLLRTGVTLLEPYGPDAYEIDIRALIELAKGYQTQAEGLIAKGNGGGNTVVTRSLHREPEAESPKRKKWWWPWGR